MKPSLARNAGRLVSIVVFALAHLGMNVGLASPPPDTATARRALERLDVPFEANAGQFDERVAFAARTFSGTTFITRDGKVVHALRGAAADNGWSLVETFVGDRASPRTTAPHPTRITRFAAGDTDGWGRDIATARAISLGEPWAGIEVALEARGANVEKLFTLAPGADAARIRVAIDGADALAVDASGALVVTTPEGAIRFTAPVAWQRIRGARRAVEARYVVDGLRYGFRLGSHDPDTAVVIDPLLQSTYLGGSAPFDSINGIAIDAAGNVFVAGATSSFDFPGTIGGAVEVPVGFGSFVAKLSADLKTLIQASYIAGANASVRALALGPAGSVYVAGGLPQTGLAGTTGGAQPAHGGAYDGFVARFSGDLRALLQATFLGGSAYDEIGAMTVDTAGNVYVAGRTESANLPGIAGGAQGAKGGAYDAFVAKLSGDLRTLHQATYFGGGGSDDAYDIAVEAFSGSVYVTGQTLSADLPGVAGGAQPTKAGDFDAFVARFRGDLSFLAQATYLGGAALDSANALSIGAGGSVFVAGTTTSADFPGTAGGAQSAFGGSFDAFVTRLAPDLRSITRSTYLGGGAFDVANALALATDGSVFVAGHSTSIDFPGTNGGLQPVNAGGDAFVARFAADLGTLVQATHLGGTSYDTAHAIAIDAAGNVLVAGLTDSFDFPLVTGGAQPIPRGPDAFIARITPDLRPGPATRLVVSLPSSAGVGATFPVKVTAFDAFDNIATWYAGTVRITTSDGAASLPADATLTHGLGTFALVLNTTGTQTVSATDTATGMTGSASIPVRLATRLVVSAPMAAGAGQPTSFSVTAYDAQGAPVVGNRVRFTSSDPAASLPADSLLETETSNFFALTLRTLGPQVITATDVSTPAITGTSDPVAVGSGPTTKFTVSAPGSVTADAPFNVAVTARDELDNVTPEYFGFVDIASSDPAAVLPGARLLVNGAGIFSVTLKTVGSQTISAADRFQGFPFGTSGPITVKAPLRLAVSAPSGATAGSPFSVTVTARNPDNTVDTTYAGTVHFTSSDGTAVLPADVALASGTATVAVTLKTAGSQTVTAADIATPTIAGTSGAIAVGAGAATGLAVAAPPGAIPGTAFAFTVTARDAFGNADSGYSGTVRFTSSDGAATLPADSPISGGSGTFSATLRTLGNQTLTATDTAAPGFSGTSPAIAVSPLEPSPASVDFGGQSMGTTSPPRTVTITNAGATSITITGVSISNAQFAQGNNCGTLAAGASCAIQLTFTPAPSAGPPGSSVAVAATLTLATASSGNAAVALAGRGERSLVTHYYRSILRRAPDSGGHAYWSNEAARVAALGADVNETWYALAESFYRSGEYAAQNRSTPEYVRDLYNTFYNRVADPGGLAFWTGQIDAGLSRDVVLTAFMFSAEFANFTQAIFGNTAVRAEVNTVMDFYRGLLGRLPDGGGFNFWVGYFRAAQCQGAVAVTQRVEEISAAFALSGEYSARLRTDSEYVGDLYNAFLRRGGDLGGFQYWVSQLAGGFRTREQTRVAFRDSFEFQARVDAIVGQGCLSP